jgi:antitoxin component YwqK of YwqJK toxin-antitoxin module
VETGEDKRKDRSRVLHSAGEIYIAVNMLKQFFLVCLSSLSLFASAQQKPEWRVTDSTDFHNFKYLDSTQYLNGKKHGRSVLYENNRLRREQQWVNGKLNGPSREYSNTGNLYKEQFYADGQLHGKSVTWQGIRMTVDQYAHGKLTDTTFAYDMRPIQYLSSITLYSDGKRKEMRQYHYGGVLSEIYYYGGALGLYDSVKSYNLKGQLVYELKARAQDSANPDPWRLRINYYPSGIPESQGMERNSSRESDWTFYDSTGKVQARKSYMFNTPHGWFTSYYPNGNVQLKTFCFNGFTDTITVYSPSGKIIPPADPGFSRIIDVQRALHRDIRFSNPNNFSRENLAKKEFIEVNLSPYEIPAGGQLPAFPGGKDSLNAFFRRNIVYPLPEKAAEEDGYVHFTFTVQADGTITDVNYAGAGSGGANNLNKEAIRVFYLMPKWIPGQSDGKNTSMEYGIIVGFHLY